MAGPPHTVVIPFGVPDEGRGLGLGLAAMVHACVNVQGQGIAIAQLHGRKKDEPADARPSPVEAFVPPKAWNDLSRRGDAPALVHVVLTGAMEPPVDGHGTLQFLAFDPRDGATRAKVESAFDAARAGELLVAALEQVASKLGGAIGPLEGLRDLEWEALESVLRAERCALHDPLRGGPHDRLAALLHLGRAIGDAPESRYPVERIASLALEAASGSELDPKLAASAARALDRASEDAPGRVELVEARGALLLRLGQVRDAERELTAAVAKHPKRTRVHMLLSQSLRAQGRLDAALTAVMSGYTEAGADLGLETEHGAVLAATGDFERAKAAWRAALARDPVHPAPFAALAGVALKQGDAATAQLLVDAALSSPVTSLEVLRRSIHLALATEGEGISRASRVARLCGRVLEQAPSDLWAALALAKSQAVLGDLAAARARLDEIQRTAPESGAAAEASAARALLEEPELEAALRTVSRAAQQGREESLEDVSARARRLATLHALWPAWLAAAIADRRRGAPGAARAALQTAVEVAPGAASVHTELAEVLLDLGEAPAALDHARRAIDLEGETPRTLRLVARALEAGDPPPPSSTRSLSERVRSAFRGWGKR